MCNFVKTWRLKMVLSAVVIVALASAANAAPVTGIQLQTGALINTCDIGVLTASCTVAAFGPFRVILGDATSFPDLSPPDILDSQISVTANANPGGSVLTVLASATGFTDRQGFLSAFTNNKPSGSFQSVKETTYWDPGDALFAKTNLLSTQTFTDIGSTGPFLVPTTPGTTFSMTEEYVFTFGPAEGSNGPSTITTFAVVPEPASLALLGGGLLVIGSFVRRFRA